MNLRVGAYVYRVRFVQGYIEHEGQRCLGLCDNETHEIFVATRTSFAQQVQVIGHEYMEAWIYHFGTAGMDKEAYCDLFGMAMSQLVLDLTRELGRLGGSTESGETGDAMQRISVPQPQGDRHDCERPGERAGNQRDSPPREPVARKLADRAARVGLRVRKVYEGGRNE